MQFYRRRKYFKNHFTVFVFLLGMVVGGPELNFPKKNEVIKLR